MDKIIGFLNEFEDWEQRLYVDYAIKTKWDENHKYFLLKYSQLESPFSEELVRSLLQNTTFSKNSTIDVLLGTPTKQLRNLLLKEGFIKRGK